jgi:hypothetical protein
LNPVKVSHVQLPARRVGVSPGSRTTAKLSPMRIELAGRRPLLRRETPVHRRDHEGTLVLDARKLLFASPLDLAASVAMAHSAAAVGVATLFMAPEDLSVTSYLERMDVFRWLPSGHEVRGATPALPRFDRSDVLAEVVPVSSTNSQNLVERVGRMAFAHLDPAVHRLAFQGIGELIDNAVSHGSSEIGAFASAQTYTGATSSHRGMEFAICDTGIGVLDHLRRNPEHRDLGDASTALRHALMPGVTGTTERRGYGLHDLFKITGNGGYVRLVLRSGDGLASIVALREERRPLYVEAADPIPGTWAWLRVRYP